VRVWEGGGNIYSIERLEGGEASVEREGPGGLRGSRRVVVIYIV